MDSKKDKNWALFIDNKPKYKKGDVALIRDANVPFPFSPWILVYVTDIIVTAKNEDERRRNEEMIEGRRPCCGRAGRGVHISQNDISYKLSNGEEIVELGLTVGIDEINKELRVISENLFEATRTLDKMREALGCGDCS